MPWKAFFLERCRSAKSYRVITSMRLSVFPGWQRIPGFTRRRFTRCLARTGIQQRTICLRSSPICSTRKVCASKSDPRRPRYARSGGWRKPGGAIEKSGPKVKTTARKARKRGARVTEGSGNVFADLGLPNPEQELLKARLTLQIYKIVKARGLTQAQAGKLLGIKQPHVSALMRNRAGNFSVGRLIEFLTALGQDVQITVKPTRKATGEMSVVMR